MLILIADARINPTEARCPYVDKFPHPLGISTKWRLYTCTQFENERTVLY